ncbi:MAG TPA: response regulator transcription factor [Planctomycetota bacterium]|nr:response regulator transcription factor [Planctomycetota bacterium]
MSEVTILAVEPDPTVLAYYRRAVVDSGYAFVPARGGEEGLRKLRGADPSAIVVRVNLPDMTGREFVTRVREEAEAVRGPGLAPILLTALRGQEAEVAAGLELGAMNVLFFPFGEGEFATRLGSLLRWAHRPAAEGVFTVGPVSVDLDRGELLLPQAQPLTASEMEILRWLLSPPGRAVTRRQIPVGTERAVDVHVAALRSKLGPAGGCIETLRGIGYRFRQSAAAL